MTERSRWDEQRARERLADLDVALADLADRGEPGPLAAVRALVDVYGEALARVLDRADVEDPALLDVVARDELVGHLLLVHDLHPHDPGTRIGRALDGLAPHITAELTELEHGVATVTVEATARTGDRPVEETVEGTVLAAAPEVGEVRVRRRTEPAFVPLTAVRAR